jgi:NADPH-dependent curcumin reductase CurA
MCLSCDPTQRGWTTHDTYLPVIKIGGVMRAFAVSEMIASRDPRFASGQLVQGLFGWQDYAVTRPDVGPYLMRPVSGGVSIETALSRLGKSQRFTAAV